MKTPTVLLAVAFLASSCGALFYRTDSPCDFSDVTLDEEVFSKVIGQLPEAVEYARQGYSQVLPGLELAGLTVHGLNKLRLFGPAIPYCTNGTRMVQVELYSDGDTHCLSSWRICSGDEGRITIRARFARLTAQFRVVNSVASGPQAGVRIAPFPL
ncbi:hypothetical protein HPB50_029216 [Hyalomma asiaticum]|nr:hypothetical protein HPB50_029216 [Hyalomma asiaticum]